MWSSTMRTTCTATWIPPFFRHRYVIHSTGRRTQMQQVVSDLEATPGIVKVRAGRDHLQRVFDFCGNVASLISIALIGAGYLSVFIISNTTLHHL